MPPRKSKAKATKGKKAGKSSTAKVGKSAFNAKHIAKATAPPKLENLLDHLDHFWDLAGGKEVRDDRLRRTSKKFSQAMGTAIALALQSGHTIPRYHKERARRLMGPQVSELKKVAQMKGKDGSSTRGGSFFGDIGKFIKKTVKDVGDVATDVGYSMLKGGKQIAEHPIEAAAAVAPLAMAV